MRSRKNGATVVMKNLIRQFLGRRRAAFAVSASSERAVSTKTTAPSFDKFLDSIVGDWAGGERVEEVMRACGGAVAGIRESSVGPEWVIEMNRGNDGFVFFNDGSYSLGPETLGTAEESCVFWSSVAKDEDNRVRIRTKICAVSVSRLLSLEVSASHSAIAPEESPALCHAPMTNIDCFTPSYLDSSPITFLSFPSKSLHLYPPLLHEKSDSAPLTCPCTSHGCSLLLYAKSDTVPSPFSSH